MRVDDLDAVLAHVTREPERAREVERITQREGDDLDPREAAELLAQRRRGAERGVNFVAAGDEAARQV
jgi:hypothetical protein